MGIGDTFSAIFCQYSIPILLSASSAAAAAAQQQLRHIIAYYYRIIVTPWCTEQGDVNYMRWTHVLGSVRMEEQVSRLSQQTQKRLI